MFHEHDLRITSTWSDTLRVGNPVHSDLVNQYMSFRQEKQMKAGIVVKQTPPLLDSHFKEIITPIRTRMRYTSDTTERVILARGIVLYSGAFRTTKRGDKLSHTLIQRIFRLSNESELLFSFFGGKTMRDGADHFLAVTYDNRSLVICPVRSVEQCRSEQQQDGI